MGLGLGAVRSHPQSLDEFWQSIPDKRIDAVRRLYGEIRTHIDPAYEETIFCGMPTWVVPMSRYPRGYHCNSSQPVGRLSLGNQGGHVAVYDMGLYADPDVLQWFVDEYGKTGWTPNMGKSCIRFTAMTRIPFELVGRLAARIPMEEFITRYEANDPRLKR